MKQLISVIAISVFITACNKVTDKNDCKDAICTAMFAAVNVGIRDSNNIQVELTDYYTVNTKNNDTIRPVSTWPDGYYTVLDDNYLQKMYNQGIDFRFIGFRNNAVVVNELFTISADCCHISKVAGKETVTVD